MWYFSWILGVGVALSFGLINAWGLESAGARIDVRRSDRR